MEAKILNLYDNDRRDTIMRYSEEEVGHVGNAPEKDPPQLYLNHCTGKKSVEQN